MSLLLNELEPRHYQDMLRSIEGSENVVEKVMTTNPRRERCREMLNFIVKQGKSAVDKLVQELVRNKQSHILEVLNAPDDEDGKFCKRFEFVLGSYYLATPYAWTNLTEYVKENNNNINITISLKIGEMITNIYHPFL